MMLPALSAGVALFELDSAHIGHWMFSRPIVLGPLLGLVCGRIELGTGLGAVIEMFCLDRQPMGGVIPLSASVAAGCAVLLCSGPGHLPASVGLPAALGLGLFHTQIEARVRLWRAGLSHTIEEALRLQGSVPWGRVLAVGIGAHWLTTAFFIYMSVAVLEPVLTALWASSPAFIKRGLDSALYAAPWLGVSAMVHILRKGV